MNEMPRLDTELIFFTSNSVKAEEATWAFGPSGARIVAHDFPFIEIQSLSQEEVLQNKISQIQRLGEERPFIVDDSGFYLNAYRFFPGVMTKFVFETIGYDGVLRLLPEGVDRSAYFRSIVGLCSLNTTRIFEGITGGSVPTEARGGHREGMLFEPLFVPNTASSTLAEMSFEERLQHAYRVKALSAAARAYSNLTT
jgi:XTP/dITP diphosphohydrolase